MPSKKPSLASATNDAAVLGDVSWSSRMVNDAAVGAQLHVVGLVRLQVALGGFSGRRPAWARAPRPPCSRRSSAADRSRLRCRRLRAAVVLVVALRSRRPQGQHEQHKGRRACEHGPQGSHSTMAADARAAARPAPSRLRPADPGPGRLRVGRRRAGRRLRRGHRGAARGGQAGGVRHQQLVARGRGPRGQAVGAWACRLRWPTWSRWAARCSTCWPRRVTGAPPS